MSTDQAELARQAKDKGTQCFKDGDLPGAATAFSTAIELDEANETLYANRSAVYVKLGKLEEALSDADKCIELKSDWVRGYTRRAQALQQLGRLEDAEESIATALEKDGNDGVSQQVATAIRRELARQTAAPEDAMLSLTSMFSEPAVWEAVKQNPEVAPLLNNPSILAKIEQLKANPKLLTESMNDPVMGSVVQAFLMAKLQAINPSVAASMAGAANNRPSSSPSSSSSSSSSSKAAPSKPAEPAKPAEPEKPKLTAEEQAAVEAKEEGNKAYAAKEWDRAIELYNKAVELDDKNILYRLNRASVHMMTNKFEECLTECDEAIAHSKAIYGPYEHRAKAYHRKGRCYLRMNQLDDAIKSFEQSMTEHRTAECLKDLRDTERLRDRRVKEAYLSPEIALEEKEKGNKFFQEGRLPEAVEAFTESLRRNPNDHTVYSNRSFCYLKLGAYPEALKDAEDTIRIDPTFMKGYIRKAQVHHRQKDFHKAVAVYEQALAIDPDSQPVKEGLQETIRAIHERRMSGKIDEASQKRAMADPDIQRILGNDEVQNFLRTSNQNPKEAQEMLKKRPSLAKNVDILMAAGVI